MEKQTMTVNGDEIPVREDTVKAYRGINWLIMTIFAVALIAAIMFFGGFFKTATDSRPNQSPAQIESQRH